MKNKAKELFHGKERLNCAQAVLKAFQEVENISDKIITDNQKNGGGRAEGGLCGALVAAHQLMPERSEEITTLFNKAADFPTCREIKTISKFPCRDCVGLAAEIVEKLRNS